MNVPDLAKHGYKSQMTVAFTRERHCNTLVDVHDDLEKLYNPHGRTFFTSKNVFR